MGRRLCLLVALALVLLWPGAAFADQWEYNITADEDEMIDWGHTSAVVDTHNHEIRLPRGAGTVDFAGEGFDYIVTTPNGVLHYSFDGQEMRENTLLSVGSVSNPVSAAVSSPYPDVIIATQNSVTHYSFTGAGMRANDVLSVTGLTHVVSVGSRNVDFAALHGDKLSYYAYAGGNSMEKVPALSIDEDLTNPIDFALFADSYDMVVLDGNQVRYFSAGSEVPGMAVSGIKQPRAIAAADGRLAVVSGSEVIGYKVQDGSIIYSSAFSVTDGLENPSAVALRPDSQDMLVVDGKEVRYYMYDGSQMIYNEQLSKQVAGLDNAGAYVRRATAQSVLVDHELPLITHIRVRAYHDLPSQTMVTWQITTDGIDWYDAWRVSSDTGLEIYDDAESAWKHAGLAIDATPDLDNLDLWIPLPEDNWEDTQIGWRATLETQNPVATPKIVTQVVWEAGAAPDPPILIDLPDGCYLTSTPELKWEFRPRDPSDEQTAFEILITPKDHPEAEFSRMVESPETSYQIPSSTDPFTPGLLWSTGAWEYELQLRAIGKLGVPSGWTEPEYFCVLAFDRPRVQSVVSQPAGYEGTVPMVIAEGMVAEDLPRAKAGSLVNFEVDVIGPIDDVTAEFPYKGISGKATIQDGFPAEITTARLGTNTCWEILFWTDASLDTVPSGTVVEAQLRGPRNDDTAIVLNAPPFADGIIVTEGSVYEDWFVILKGRDKAEQ